MITRNFNKQIQMAMAAIALLALLFTLFAVSAGTRFTEEHNIASLASATPAQDTRAEQEPESYIEEEPEPVFQPLDVPLNADVQYEISLMCLEAGVPFEVEMALIERESDFAPALVSDTDDHGLAQINRCNFGWLQEELGPIDFYDPIQNVRASLRILGPLWAKNSPHKALMAYNCGENGARRRWNNGQATSRYSREVLAQAEAFGWNG
jgi:hypothetical protein